MVLVLITKTQDSTYTKAAGIGYFYTNANTETNTTAGFGGKWEIRNYIIFEASIGVGQRFGLWKEVESMVITEKGILWMDQRF